MLFPTLSFFIFFLAVLVLNWLLKKWPFWWRFFLLVSSYFFYATWNFRFLILIFLLSLFNFWSGALIAKNQPEKRKKIILGSVIALNIGVLAVFKYFGFFAESARTFLMKFDIPADFLLLNVILPVGLSFYILRAISYNIDIFRGKQKPEASLIDFLIYISFFPQLLAGPIMRAGEFLPQLKNGGAKTVENIPNNFVLILSGLFKKIVIASFLSVKIVDDVFAFPQDHSQLMVLLAVYAFAIVIYCDFSGYSDIAMGLAGLMGFKSPINFNSPYLSLDFRDFWRRWHITFSNWLRDYVYIPLGGSQKGKLRTYLNSLATMLVSGLWHGAGLHFAFWGLLHGIGITASRLGRFSKFSAWFITFNAVSFFWIFFRADSIKSALDVLKQLFNWQAKTEPIEIYALFLILSSFIIFALGGKIKKIFIAFQENISLPWQIVSLAIIAILIIKLGPDIIPPFIYFKF